MNKKENNFFTTKTTCIHYEFAHDAKRKRIPLSFDDGNDHTHTSLKIIVMTFFHTHTEKSEWTHQL